MPGKIFLLIVTSRCVFCSRWWLIAKIRKKNLPLSLKNSCIDPPRRGRIAPASRSRQ